VPRGSLGFGIVRSVEPAQGRAQLSELCAALTRDVGTLFVPHHPPTYADLVKGCESGELSVAWVPPIATARLREMGAVHVLALPVRRGAVSYRAALITRQSGPASLADVRSATVGWVDPESCSGYVVPRLFLGASALDFKQLFAREVFLGSHSAVVDAVVSRRVDVGATFCATSTSAGDPRAASVPSEWAGPSGKLSPPLRVLAATGPIPNDAIVVSSQLSVDLRSRLLRWFLDLREGRATRFCADLFGAGAFRVAATEHFTALQQMMWAARANGAVVP
jgi:phosphonate transport system substrate-binding protein